MPGKWGSLACRAAGKHDRHVDPLNVHGRLLGAAVPIARFRFRVHVDLLGHEGHDAGGVTAVLRRVDASAHLDAQVPGMAAQPFRAAVLESRVNVPVPKVCRLYDVHVGVHDFEAVFCHF